MLFIKPTIAGCCGFWLSITVNVISSTVAADSAITKQLDKAADDFVDRRKTAKESLLREFDKLAGLVSANKSLTPGASRDKLGEVAAAKSRFIRNGTFPPDDEYAGLELKYCLALNSAFMPLEKAINQAMDSGDEARDKAKSMKASVESLLLGRNKVAANSLWRGTFDRGGGTIPYHLRIQKVGAGGSFSGHVEDNPGVAGNWAYDVDGQMSGVAIEFVMTRSLRGQFKAVKAQGIVSGNRIIAQVTQVTTGEMKKGHSTAGLIILQLAK
jgi:hypothetical protein